MKRATATVCRTLADIRDQMWAELKLVKWGAENVTSMDMGAVKWVNELEQCIMRLSPPQKKRPRDVPRSAGIKERRATMRECDTLFRDLIRARDGCCRRCGGSSHLQVAHVFSRRFIRIRHHPLNAMLLCAKCHLHVHHHPVEAGQFFEKELGPTKYKMLAGLKASNSRLPDLQLVKAGLLRLGKTDVLRRLS